MRNWLFTIVALACIALSGCSGDNVMLDNARSSKVTITIDGGEGHSLEPGARKPINLAEGKHEVKIKDSNDSTLVDTTFDLKSGGVLHAGGDAYLVWKQMYGIQKDRATVLHEEWVEFDSIRAFGDIKVFPANVPYIEKCWDKGLEEILPQTLTISTTKDYEIQSKVFRGKEFVETYKNMAQQKK
jgi:hypothetical protein